MPIDASIPLQVQPLKLESPMNQLAMMSDAMKIGEYQRSSQEQNQLRDLIRSGVDMKSPEFVRKAYEVSPALGMKVEETQAKNIKLGLEGKKLSGDVEEQSVKAMRERFANLRFNPSPENITANIQDGILEGKLTPAQGAAAIKEALSVPFNQRAAYFDQKGLDAEKRVTTAETMRSHKVNEGIAGGHLTIAKENQQRGAIPAGYRMSADGKALEAIPGGPTTTPLAPKEVQKREASYSKATQAVKTVETKAKTLLDDIQLLKDHPGLDEITGIAGGRLPGYSSSGRAAKAIYDRIVARGGFTELQDMRNASPTGGALGNVSNQENQSLRDAWAAISRIQDAKDLRNQLTRAANDVTGSVQRIREAYDTDYEYKASAPGAAPKTPAATPSAGGSTVTTPDGKVFTFPTAEAAAQFRKNAKIKD
jgi:hypothetical protein